MGFLKDKIEIDANTAILELRMNGQEHGGLSVNKAAVELPMDCIIWYEQHGFGYKSEAHLRMNKNLEKSKFVRIYLTPLTGELKGLPCHLVLGTYSKDNYDCTKLIASNNNSLSETIFTISLIEGFGNFNTKQLGFSYKKITEWTPEIECVAKYVKQLEETEVDFEIPLPNSLEPVKMIAGGKEIKKIEATLEES